MIIDPTFGSWGLPAFARTGFFCNSGAHAATADKLTLRAQTVSAVDAPFRRELRRNSPDALSPAAPNRRFQVDAPGHITVITVVRNAAEGLLETIASVESSGYPNLDLIIVDGGSTDGTVDVIKSHADKLHWWVSEADKGIYDAMNKGWRAARNDSRILFLGAGDRIISLPDLSGGTTDDVLFGDVWIGDRLFRGKAGIALCYGNTLHHQALLVPKSIHPEPPFDTRFRLYADFDFNQRLLKMGARFVRSPHLAGYALPGGASSRKDYRELATIITGNFGVHWVIMAFLAMVFKRLRHPLWRGETGKRS